MFFSSDEERTNVILKSNAYLSSERNYEETRNKLKHINIHFQTVDVIKEKIEGEYDVIWLSNIKTRLSHEMIKQMVDNVMQNLKENGMLLISYLYQTVHDTEYNEDWSPIYHLEKTLEILRDYSPYFHEFIGMQGLKFHDETEKDCILLCKKESSVS